MKIGLLIEPKDLKWVKPEIQYSYIQNPKYRTQSEWKKGLSTQKITDLQKSEIKNFNNNLKRMNQKEDSILRIAYRSNPLKIKTISDKTNKAFNNIKYSMKEKETFIKNDPDSKNNDYLNETKINQNNKDTSFNNTEIYKNIHNDSISVPQNDKTLYIEQIPKSTLVLKGHNVFSVNSSIEGIKLIGSKNNPQFNLIKPNFKFININQIDSNVSQNSYNGKTLDNEPLYSSFAKNFIFNDPLKNYPRQKTVNSNKASKIPSEKNDDLNNLEKPMNLINRLCNNIGTPYDGFKLQKLVISSGGFKSSIQS